MQKIDEAISDEFKIRSSAVSDIMGGALKEGGLTEKQKETMNELLVKSATKILTSNQSAELAVLMEKYNSKPELPEGAKTYCEKWLKRRIELYGNNKIEMSNEKTEKGLIVEDHAIDFIAEMLDIPFAIKNEERLSNDYMAGTPDVRVGKHFIIDNKSSWDEDTFPLFDEKVPDSSYWWQGQSYMELDDVDDYLLIYTLMDLPENMIRRKAGFHYKMMGYDEVTQDMYEEFKKHFTYGHVAKELRIRVFSFKRDRTIPAKIKQRVEMCRDYIKTLIIQINSQVEGMDKFKFSNFVKKSA